MTSSQSPRQPFYPEQKSRVTMSSKTMRLQILGAILWPSFFSACVATMVFFAIVDPEELNQITWADIALGREFGYTLGFFMFWVCTSAASLFTWILLRPASAVNQHQSITQDVP